MKPALANNGSYQYRGGGVGDKTLTVLIAPTAVGKSTIIAEVLRLCSDQGIDAAEVGSLTTRRRRPGSDPTHYRTADEGITHDWMTNKIQKGELINWSLSPTGEIYGTDKDSFSAKYNLLPFLPDSLPFMRQAGFLTVHSVYITVPVVQWTVQLGDRLADPGFNGRLQEAVSSLEFALQHRDQLHFVHNNAAPGTTPHPTMAAQAIIDIMTTGTSDSEDTDAAAHLEAMHTYAISRLGEASGTL